jgi:membrane fusion protein
MPAADGTLFRAEVIREQSARFQGRAIVPTPPLLAWGAAGGAVLLAALALLLALGHYAPRQSVPGFLAPERGVVRVFAQRAGKVDVLLVRDGERVRAGQPLAMIAVDQALVDAGGRSVLARILDELTAEQARLQEGFAREQDSQASARRRARTRIGGLERELAAARDETAALERQLEGMRGVLRRIEELHRSGYVAEVDLALRRQQVLELERQRHAQEKALAGMAQQLDDARLELAGQRTLRRERRADLESRLSDLRRRIAAHEIERGFALLAPAGGVVTNLQAEPGPPVRPEQPLMTLVPEDSPLEAQLLVPSRAAGFVAPGQEVRLRYAAFPHEHYGVHRGRVTAVGRATLRAEDLAAGLALAEPVYRVTVALDAQAVQARGETHPLRAGMLLEADILLEPRPLWAWFLEPLLALRGRT